MPSKNGKAPRVERATLADLKPDPKNARRHNPRNIGMIADAMHEVGAGRSIVIDENNVVRAGNGAVEAAAQAGIHAVTIVEASGNELVAVRRANLTEAQKQRLALFDNRSAELADWDPDVLGSIPADDLRGIFSDDELAAILAQQAEDENRFNGEGTPLADRFVAPPFSVLDARQGYWRERKAAWLALGIESEVGRGKNLLKHNTDLGMADQATSVFDPVLCEAMYRWFSPESGVVLDPFAGGSVRGVIASRLGRAYFGLELRKEQIAANRAQATQICRREDPDPTWLECDAAKMSEQPEIKRLQADFLFSCPPYFDLERYSDDPRDLSNQKSDAAFIAKYERIVSLAVDRLRNHRFACFVVGDVREAGKSGYYRGLPYLTVRAFEAAGARLYNEAVLVTPVGTLRLRVGKMFTSARKLGPSHQHVLIFCKGDPRKAVAALGTPEFGQGEDVTESFGEPL